MITGTDINNLKKTLAKNPKSLLFAQYAEVLRSDSLGNKQKLDGALLVANKGVEANPDFLLGKLVRGRILLEKGDLAAAKIDFEAVAKRDSFCLSAQKLLLETAEKLEEPLDTEIYANILNIFEGKADKAEPGNAPDLVPFTRPQKAKPSAAETTSLSAALDDILEEDAKEENEVETLVFKAVDNILDSGTPQPPPKPQPKPLPLPEATSIFEKEPVAMASEPLVPNIDDLVKEQLADKPVDNLPDLTADMDSLLAASKPSTPNIDDIVKEQLADRPVDNLPDLTGDMASLLALESTSHPSVPQIDDIVKEQLADRTDNLPDLTGDMASLLSTVSEPEPELKPYVPPTSQIDDIVKEQLTDRMDNLPDLTGDMAALLSTAPEPEPELKPYVPTPQIDDIVKEQLADRMDNLPDLTGDMTALLSTAPEPEPELKPYVPPTSQIDDIVKEQLTNRMDRMDNLPDLTGDMAALLADDEILTQKPTLTLAELYMDQGLPQKAAVVYKELLAQDPGNEELKMKLALTEGQV